MDNVIKIFKQIQSTSSLNSKKEIISVNKDNALFKYCLLFLLDGNIVTGISEKKLRKKVNVTSRTFCNDFIDMVEYLRSHDSGRDVDISVAQKFLESQPEEDREFYEQMITKKFRLGADAKLVNKCISGLIPTFDVMLGTSIENTKIPDGIWFSLSHKLNGNRAVYYNGEFYTRQGKKYSGLEHIKKDIEEMSKFFSISHVFDGELIYKNSEGLSDSAAFQKGTGIAQSKNETKEELKFIVFDVLPKIEFDNGNSILTYKKRRGILNDLRQYQTENIEIVDMFYEGTDQSQIWKWLDYCEENDLEGCMLNLDTPYECKRTKNLVKIKKFFDLDLQIIDAEEGTGRNKGRLGAFVVDYLGNRVKVGTGFTDEERDLFWSNKEEYIGRVITIKYKEKTKDKKTGLDSLQFPVYISIREQGKEVSYD